MKIMFSVLILISLAHFGSSATKNSYECVNPNNKPGVCISLYTCPTVLQLFLNADNTSEDDIFLQKSYCGNGFGTSPFVCCSNEGSLISDNILATQEECTHEFYLSLAAWKVYTNSICVGSLISSRYILTSSWCASNAERKLIRLGKLDTPDITIEKRIGHENYENSADYGYENDIGLVRLSRSVQFDQNTAPICLPSAVNGYKNYQLGDSIRFPVLSGPNLFLTTAGKIVKECADNRFAADNQICVGGDISIHNDDLRYGNPLVAQYNGTWIIDGVFGFHHKHNFSLFARVSDYEKWILGNLEP